MAVNGRRKGSKFELDVAKMLFDELGISFKRDLEQYRAGDHGDLIPDDDSFPFVLELKRYAGGPVGGHAGWWEQVCKAANRENKLPALLYKYDRKPIRCVLPLAAIMENHHGYLIEVGFSTFCYIAREIMNDISR